jgi:hypothetical protein
VELDEVDVEDDDEAVEDDESLLAPSDFESVEEDEDDEDFSPASFVSRARFFVP